MKIAIAALAAAVLIAPAALAQEHDHGAHHGEDHAEHAHDAAHYASARHAEHTLRDTIAALQAGEPNYDRMVPELAEAVRQQSAAMGPQMAAMGAVMAIEHQAEVQPGVHQFQVTFENAQNTWFISVNAEDKIQGLLIQ